MKTVEPSILNKQAYDFFSTVHEPVKINKLGFFISLEEVEQITRKQINSGILKGLEDVKAGRVTLASEGHKKSIIDRIQK